MLVGIAEWRLDRNKLWSGAEVLIDIARDGPVRYQADIVERLVDRQVAG